MTDSAPRAFRLAAQAFGADGLDARLGPALVDWMVGTRDHVETSSPLEALRRLRVDEARVDPDRVHPSWWVRALQDEAPAVRRAVADGAPPGARALVLQGLGLAEADLVPAHPPDPGALAVARALWSERLAGGPPPGPDDPPVAHALAGEGRRLQRLAAALGAGKLAVAGREAPSWLREGQRAVFDLSTSNRDNFTPEFVELSALDVGENLGLPLLGFIGLGRLLRPLPPRRARWLLQHLPYPLAKFVRGRMSPGDPGPSILAGESRLLDLARAPGVGPG